MSKKMKPVIALIVPLYDPNAKPDQGLPGKPPGEITPPEWQLPHPENPIFWPLPPGAPVDPDYGIDENAPYPDQGLPGHQPRPDHDLPPFPSHPIVLPPGGGGWEPVYIWGPNDPRPTPPIEIPEPIPPEGGRPEIKFIPIWTPATGWVVIGLPQGPHPVPSRKKK